MTIYLVLCIMAHAVTASTESEKAEPLNQFFHSVINTGLDNCPLDCSALPNSSLSSIDISYENTFMVLTPLEFQKQRMVMGFLLTF